VRHISHSMTCFVARRRLSGILLYPLVSLHLLQRYKDTRYRFFILHSSFHKSTRPIPLLPYSTMKLLLQSIVALCAFNAVSSLNIVVAGGSGKVGRLLSSTLHSQNKGHEITVLCRNAFLASAPSRVSGDFGWLGEVFLNTHYSVQLRDWDGGDLLDIVGCDWQGWQDDALPKADVIVNLVGGYTEQRTMACERLVRESLRLNPAAKQILLSMNDADLKTSLKKNRAKACEDMLTTNCLNSVCLRAEMFDVKGANNQIMDIINNMA